MKKQNTYYKIGRLRQPIAKQAHIQCADIVISTAQLRHIEKKHQVELSQLGISAEIFVKTVLDNFNQIRAGSQGSYLLVVYKEPVAQVAAIRLNYSLKKEFWEVKTATPMRAAELLNKVLIWERSAPFK